MSSVKLLIENCTGYIAGIVQKTLDMNMESPIRTLETSHNMKKMGAGNQSDELEALAFQVLLQVRDKIPVVDGV